MRVASQLSLHCCVGVVHNPSKGILQGEAEWSCRLLVNQIGVSACASDSLIASQDAFNLRCRGSDIVNYCVSNVREGDLVHVMSKLIHRPRYVPIHGDYFEETELLVSDSFGCLDVVAVQ